MCHVRINCIAEIFAICVLLWGNDSYYILWMDMYMYIKMIPLDISSLCCRKVCITWKHFRNIIFGITGRDIEMRYYRKEKPIKGRMYSKCFSAHKMGKNIYLYTDYIHIHILFFYHVYNSLECQFSGARGMFNQFYVW